MIFQKLLFGIYNPGAVRQFELEGGKHCLKFLSGASFASLLLAKEASAGTGIHHCFNLIRCSSFFSFLLFSFFFRS
jgi:hypothetical protein